eukprot:g39233.t1
MEKISDFFQVRFRGFLADGVELERKLFELRRQCAAFPWLLSNTGQAHHVAKSLPRPSEAETTEPSYLRTQQVLVSLLRHGVTVESGQLQALVQELSSSAKARRVFAHVQNEELARLDREFRHDATRYANQGLALNKHNNNNKRQGTRRIYRVDPATGVIRWSGQLHRSEKVAHVLQISVGSSAFAHPALARPPGGKRAVAQPVPPERCFTLHLLTRRNTHSTHTHLSADTQEECERFVRYLMSLKAMVSLCAETAPVLLPHQPFRQVCVLNLEALRANTIACAEDLLCVTSIMHAARRLARPLQESFVAAHVRVLPKDMYFLKTQLAEQLIKNYPLVFWESYFWTQVGGDYAQAQQESKQAKVALQPHAWIVQALKHFRDELLDWGVSVKGVKEVYKWFHSTNDLPDACLFTLFKHADSRVEQCDVGAKSSGHAEHAQCSPFKYLLQGKSSTSSQRPRRRSFIHFSVRPFQLGHKRKQHFLRLGLKVPPFDASLTAPACLAPEAPQLDGLVQEVALCSPLPVAPSLALAAPEEMALQADVEAKQRASLPATTSSQHSDMSPSSGLLYPAIDDCGEMQPGLEAPPAYNPDYIALGLPAGPCCADQLQAAHSNSPAFASPLEAQPGLADDVEAKHNRARNMADCKQLDQSEQGEEAAAAEQLGSAANNAATQNEKQQPESAAEMQKRAAVLSAWAQPPRSEKPELKLQKQKPVEPRRVVSQIYC